MPEQAETAQRPVLVAIDFSPFSERALLWAARAARGFGAPLVVLHVVHDPASEPGYYQRAAGGDEPLQRIEEAAAEMMTEFLDRIDREHPELLADADRRLVIGVPVTRILEVAADVGAELIVMGSHGRTGLSHLMLGSKALSVAQLSPVPVTIVKAPEWGA
ncbi:MAG: universal stress protein [Myxococcales bacterium]|nr:universal stress protein [Myxococcales bacterium]